MQKQMQENNHGQKKCKGKMCFLLLYRNAIGLACRLLTCFCVGGSLCWRVVACACRCVAIVRLSFLWRVVSLAVGLSLHRRAEKEKRKKKKEKEKEKEKEERKRKRKKTRKKRKRGPKGVPPETAQKFDFLHKSLVWKS